jgi:hypothetical protein
MAEYMMGVMPENKDARAARRPSPMGAAGSRPGSGPMPLPGNASVRDDRLVAGRACSPRTSATSAAEISVDWFRAHHLERACRLLRCRLDLLLALEERCSGKIGASVGLPRYALRIRVPRTRGKTGKSKRQNQKPLHRCVFLSTQNKSYVSNTDVGRQLPVPSRFIL